MTSLSTFAKPESLAGELTGRQVGVASAGVYGLSAAALSGFGSAYAFAPLAEALLGGGALDGSNKYAVAQAAAPLLAGAAPAGDLAAYGRPWPGTYATYRVMSAHPTLVLAGAAVMAPVLTCEWSFETTRAAPAEARDFLQGVLEPMRVPLLMECLRALVFGWRGFEKVYASRNGYLTLDRLKPLLPELTSILVDERGHVAGLAQEGLTLPAEKVFVYSYDRDGDDHYGRSRHENCRRAWSCWLADDDNLGRLGSKVSSIIPHVGYPPGTGHDERGREQSNFQIALQLAHGMASGRPVVMPNLAGLTLDDLTRLPELASASLWHIGTLDLGNPGPAQQALISALKYRDALLVRGWMRPERSLLEAQRGGSRADAEAHADLGMTDCELVHGDIARCLNAGVVDDLLAYNFGETARGTVAIRPAPLVDEKKLVDSALLQGVLRDPKALFELIARTDMDAWMDRAGLPRGENATPWPATGPTSAG